MKKYKSNINAFLLLAPCYIGIIGLHRFYTRKYKSGIITLFTGLIIFGTTHLPDHSSVWEWIYWGWVLWEVCTVNKKVRKINSKILHENTEISIKIVNDIEDKMYQYLNANMDNPIEQLKTQIEDLLMPVTDDPAFKEALAGAESEESGKIPLPSSDPVFKEALDRILNRSQSTSADTSTVNHKYELKRQVYERKISEVCSDFNITPQKDKEISLFGSALSIAENDLTNELIVRARRCTEVINGNLPVIESHRLNLAYDDVLHYIDESCEMRRKEKGSSDDLEDIDSGTLFVSQKETWFIGNKKNIDLGKENIIKIQPYADCIGFFPRKGKPFYLFSEESVLFYLIYTLRDLYVHGTRGFAGEKTQISLEFCYELLGLSSGASVEEVKNAYREKAKIAHPDKGGDPSYFSVLTKAKDSLLKSLK